MSESSYDPTTGRATCQACSEWVMVGRDPTKFGGVTCGDCAERRTPLKRELATLRAENERLRAALTEVEERLESIEVHEGIHRQHDAHSGTCAREALEIVRAALRGGQ